ncbi:kinase-like domain-containing protein [Cladochytrium replicatum]|nr:kinase-like domain-containing protein [Cladochytrium replicatum]
MPSERPLAPKPWQQNHQQQPHPNGSGRKSVMNVGDNGSNSPVASLNRPHRLSNTRVVSPESNTAMQRRSGHIPFSVPRPPSESALQGTSSQRGSTLTTTRQPQHQSPAVLDEARASELAALNAKLEEFTNKIRDLETAHTIATNVMTGQLEATRAENERLQDLLRESIERNEFMWSELEGWQADLSSKVQNLEGYIAEVEWKTLPGKPAFEVQSGNEYFPTAKSVNNEVHFTNLNQPAQQPGGKRASHKPGRRMVEADASTVHVGVQTYADPLNALVTPPATPKQIAPQYVNGLLDPKMAGTIVRAPKFNINLETVWSLDTRIGAGAFGEVYLATRRISDRTLFAAAGPLQRGGKNGVDARWTIQADRTPSPGSPKHYGGKKQYNANPSPQQQLQQMQAQPQWSPGVTERAIVKRIAKSSPGVRWEPHAGLQVTLPTEAMLMAQSGGHPNVMPLLETYEDASSFYFVMPCIPGHTRDLEQVLYVPQPPAAPGQLPISPPALSPDKVRRIFSQLMRAMAFLHNERRIAHRDIKPANLVVNDLWDLCVIDLGLAHRIETDELGRELDEVLPNGTPVYAPPEVHGRQPYKATKADIWAAGCVLYELVEGVKLFTRSEEVVRIVDRGALYSQLFARRSRGKQGSRVWPGGADVLVERLLDPDPSCRPDAAEVMRDPWVAGGGGGAVGNGWN